jgi:phosphomannomutase
MNEIVIDWHKLQNGSDLRGVAIAGVADEDVNLTPQISVALGKAFVSWLATKLDKPSSSLVISVGRDSRLSGKDLMSGLIEGIIHAGSRVYNFDLASTPAMFMSTVTSEYSCDGAIMLTASHLPFNRNGFKFFTAQGGLGKQDISNILSIAEQEQFLATDQPGTVEERDFMAVYAQQLVDKIRLGVNAEDYDRPLKGLKIVVDAGNGAGGFYVNRVLQPLGADTSGSQFLEPDGTFPNHVPNPEDKQAMAAICKAVIDNKADFGIIFDTDVDRGAAVDSQGKELNRNRLIASISAIVLREHPGSTVVTDSITSDGLTKFIERDLSGIHHRYKRGYKNVIDEAIRLNNSGQESWLAIETSGHGAMQENYFLDDGAYLVSKLVIELAKSKLAGKNLTDLIANFQEPVESEEFRLKIKVADFKTYGNKIIDLLQTFITQQSNWSIVPHNYEGVRVSCNSVEERGWFLLRLSLHDPVLPLNIESNVEGGVSKIANKLIEFFQDKPDLDITALKVINDL